MSTKNTRVGERIEFMDRYMDTLDSLLDEEIDKHNQSLDDNERRK